MASADFEIMAGRLRPVIPPVALLEAFRTGS